MFVSVCDDNGWTETSVNWNNKPISCSDAIGKVSPDGIANLDVVAAMQSITDRTLTIKLWNPPTSTQVMTVYSKNNGDSSQVPLLYVGVGDAAEIDATTGTTSATSSITSSILYIALVFVAMVL